MRDGKRPFSIPLAAMALGLAACAQPTTHPQSVGSGVGLLDLLTLRPGEYHANMQLAGLDQAFSREMLPDFLKAMQGVNTGVDRSRNFCITEEMLEQARAAISNESRFAEICTIQPAAMSTEHHRMRLRCRVPIGNKIFALATGSVGPESLNLMMKVPIPDLGQDGISPNAGVSITAHRVGDCTRSPAPEANEIQAREHK